MGEPDAGVVERDVIDLITDVTGDLYLTRRILEHLADQRYIVVALRPSDIQAAAFAISAVVEGVPPTLFMAALAEHGAYVVMRPELRHDLHSQVDGSLLATHPADRCEGGYCVIHNPSDHPLKDAPIHWDEERRRTDRVCRHDQHHPDPDHLAYVADTQGMLEYLKHKRHDCDGCCRRKEGTS